MIRSNTENPYFELNSIVSKEGTTGKVFTVMIHLPPWKDEAARRFLIDALLYNVVTCGLQYLPIGEAINHFYLFVNIVHNGLW